MDYKVHKALDPKSIYCVNRNADLGIYVPVGWCEEECRWIIDTTIHTIIGNKNQYLKGKYIYVNLSDLDHVIGKEIENISACVPLNMESIYTANIYDLKVAKTSTKYLLTTMKKSELIEKKLPEYYFYDVILYVEDLLSSISSGSKL